MDKKEELEGIIEGLSKVQKDRDNFLRALYTDTIVKKGVFYIYNGGEDSKVSIEPFINTLKEKEYQHEALFKKYASLDERDKVIIDVTSDRRLENLSMEEGTKTLILNIDALLENFKDCIEELDIRRYQLVNGDELFTFYNEMLPRLKEVRKQLEQ
jgi:hypothetical protein